MTIPEREASSRELDVWHGLIRVVATVGDLLEEQLGDVADLDIKQFLILLRLNTSPPGRMTMTDLADGQSLSRSGMTHQVGKLEALGLVSRRTARADERAREVALTDAGRARVAELEPLHKRLLAHLLFDQIEPGELDELQILVAKINSHLATAPPRSVRRRNSRSHRVSE